MILAGVGVDWVLFFLGLDLNNSVGLGHTIQYHSLLTAVPQRRLRTGGPKSRWELPDYMVTIPQLALERIKYFVGEEHCYWLRVLQINNYFEKQFFDCLKSGLVLMEIALAEWQKKPPNWHETSSSAIQHNFQSLNWLEVVVCTHY